MRELEESSMIERRLTRDLNGKERIWESWEFWNRIQRKRARIERIPIMKIAKMREKRIWENERKREIMLKRQNSTYNRLNQPNLI